MGMRTTFCAALAAVTLAAVTLAGPAQAQGLPALVQSGEAFGPGTWLVSDWNAGQSPRVRWHPDNVRLRNGELRFVLNRAPDGAERPLRGGEIQSGTNARTGTWRWRARAPRMVPGAVFGLFLYKADYRTQPWREYDIEFVGADTTEIQINIHFETEDGRHVSLDQAKGGPVIVDLGFDAAAAMHTYEIVVRETEAVFRVDGTVVGHFGPADMPENTWRPGPLRAFVDIWAVGRAQEAWAGVWRTPNKPLVGAVRSVTVPSP